MNTHFNQFSLLVLSVLFMGISTSFIQSLLESTMQLEISKNYFLNGIIMQLFVFIGGGMLFLKLTGQHLRSTLQLAPIHKRGLWIGGMFFVLTILFSQLFAYLNVWITDFEMFESAVLKHKAIVKQQTDLILQLTGIEIVYGILFFALLPAIAEEFLFRGLLQRIFINWTNSVAWGIFSTALCFSIMHFQIQSLLSILVVGIILGYVYEQLKSIWYPILIHFFYNALQVLIIVYG